jgi:hypothetical protein
MKGGRAMRTFVTAVAAAGAVFALTAAGAGAAGLKAPDAATVTLKTLAKQAVTLEDCQATSVEITYGYVTNESSSNYGKVSSATVTVNGNSLQLEQCEKVDLNIDGSSYLGVTTFGSATGTDPNMQRAATFTFSATDTIASTVRALITP